MEVPGFDNEERIYAPTDIQEIHLVPAMFGGGGNFFKIVVGAVLIGLSFIMPQFAPILMSMGIGMVLGGVMGLFMKAPSSSKSEDPPASKYFGINGNTADAGTPITLAYGRINLFGHWLSLQSDADNLVVGTFPGTPT